MASFAPLNTVPSPLGKLLSVQPHAPDIVSGEMYLSPTPILFDAPVPDANGNFVEVY